jgi:hypothetical protein
VPEFSNISQDDKKCSPTVLLQEGHPAYMVLFISNASSDLGPTVMEKELSKLLMTVFWGSNPKDFKVRVQRASVGPYASLKLGPTVMEQELSNLLTTVVWGSNPKDFKVRVQRASVELNASLKLGQTVMEQELSNLLTTVVQGQNPKDFGVRVQVTQAVGRKRKAEEQCGYTQSKRFYTVS